MATKKPSFNLTGILIQDKDQRGYTAYFAEFPEAIADGITPEEAKANLFTALQIILETRKLESYPSDKAAGGVIQESFEFELAAA